MQDLVSVGFENMQLLDRGTQVVQSNCLQIDRQHRSFSTRRESMPRTLSALPVRIRWSTAGLKETARISR